MSRVLDGGGEAGQNDDDNDAVDKQMECGG